MFPQEKSERNVRHETLLLQLQAIRVHRGLDLSPLD